MEKKKTILVVDDEKDIAELLILELEENGFKCLEANTGQEAYEIWENNKDIDLILTDVKMPKSDGLELVRKIRNSNESVPIFVCTGIISETIPYFCLKNGVNNYVEKPFKVEEIIRTINELIEKQEKS